MIRILALCVLTLCLASPRAWSAETTPAAPTVDEATRIAADLIVLRARDSENAGRSATAAQLHALAKGLLSGRVTLYDASLVMQIALVEAPSASRGAGASAGVAAAPASSPPASDPKASARQA
nr:hypothetical protein [Planctomycetota bacterium]